MFTPAILGELHPGIKKDATDKTAINWKQKQYFAALVQVFFPFSLLIRKLPIKIPPAVPGIKVIPDATPAFIVETSNCAIRYFTTNGPKPVDIIVPDDKANVLNIKVGFFSRFVVAGIISFSFPRIRISAG